MSKVRPVIIGSGVIGYRFIEDLPDKSDAANSNITVLCKEPYVAYDCVHFSSHFSHHTAEELSPMREGFYEKHGIKVLVSECVITINRQEKMIHPNAGRIVFCGKLIMATGSCLWISSTKGSDTQDCLTYRITEDLNAIRSCVRHDRRGTVVGGGLLGLEAASALKNLGIETHVIEFAPVLMAGQPDQMSDEQLHRKIKSMGVCVHISKNTLEIMQEGVEARRTMRFADGNRLEVGFIVFSTGIRPCDKLAAQCGLDVTPRGGIVIDDSYQTSDSDIYAIGECTNWNNCVFGLVAPDYKMARVATNHVLDNENAFEGAGLSAKLKLLGVDVGGIGDVHGRISDVRSYVYLDGSKEIYKCLIASEDNKTLLGAIPASDTSDYDNLLQLVLNAIELPENPDSLILPAHLGSSKSPIGVDKLPDSMQICSYFDVTEGDLIAAINKGCHTAAALKVETKAGTGCGSYIPLVTQVLNAELAKQGIEVNNNLCGHSAYSRQELLHLIHVKGIRTFEGLLAEHDKGYDCEVCKPTIGSLLISCWNEYILKLEHTPLQDSNDNFLAGIRKDGIYPVIPRFPGNEVTSERLVTVGRIAHEFNPYTKITGSQRLAMFGVQEGDPPEIRRRLIEADFETDRAYAEALHMAETCAGGTWRRHSVGDSIGLGVELENRYRGICTPHKIELGISGHTRECSEAQGKDVGIVATEKGWSLYVCGNGGMKPRHTDLLAADIGREALTRYLDCFMMLYIRVADKLTRTVPWLENPEGGIDYLKAVIIGDKLGLNVHLEEEMVHLCEAVVCGWTKTVNTPSAQTHLRYFINSDKRDPNVQMVSERGQHRPTAPYEHIPVILVEDNA